ncbi:MAG TPA: hypothetical protein VGH28_10390 [Polyangiaceae bacterium]|jgi:hypothetical protein
MNDRDFRDQMIALAVSRQLVALHSLGGEDRELPGVVIGRIVKVTSRSVVIATEGNFESPMPLASVTKLEPLEGAPTAPEAA